MKTSNSMIVFLFTICVTRSVSLIVPPPSIPTLSVSPRSTACQAFIGNSDFYGLGIRLGVYLQWLSSWTTNTMNPKAAAANHDANSIFVLAAIVALLVSLSTNTVRPVEAYIMLLICFGFLFTVLSRLGIRLHFLRARSGAEFVQKIKACWPKVQESWKSGYQNDQNTSSSPLLGILWYGVCRNPKIQTLKLVISFKTASFLKHFSVSWAGVAWRSTIASLVSMANIWLWYSPWRTHNNTENGACMSTVFFFGERKLEGSLVTFFKAASIVLAIPDFILCIFFICVLIKTVEMTRNFIIRHFVISAVETRQAGSWDKLPREYKILLGMITETSNFRTLVSHGVLPLTIDDGFWNIKKDDLPAIKDLLNAQISFWCREIEAEKEAKAEAVGNPGLAARSICTILHASTLVAIACFVTFIEVTIAQNAISGVYTIGTTGQLIPFIIGITSFIASLRDIVFLRLRQKFPDWSAYYLSFHLGLGTMQLKEMKTTKADVRDTTVMPDMTMRDQARDRQAGLQEDITD